MTYRPEGGDMDNETVELTELDDAMGEMGELEELNGTVELFA